jgi:hypothetical protein
MPRSPFLLLVAIVFALTLPLTAQKTTGTLGGSVFDSSGAMVPGAEVTVTNPMTGQVRKTTTNDQGQFSVAELPPSSYSVRVSKSGFKESVQTGVELHVGDLRDLRMKLEVGQQTETVTVEANTVGVETQTGTVSNTILGQQVRELPLNGHNFIQLTTLMPGVSPAQGFDPKGKGLSSGVQLAVSGSGANNNLFLVDGANNNDIGSNNTILIYPSVETIQEFKILRNNFGPEFGQSSGGQINIITRSGTNLFHGSAYYFGRNDALNAWEYEAKSSRPAVCPNPDPVTNNACDKNKLRRHDYGYTIGGPIIKDKAFFFWSQEWNRETRSNIRTAYAPTAAEKAGDFSQSCPTRIPTDPLTGLPFPGNVIPAARISPAGSLLVQQYGDANFNLGDPCAETNFVFSAPAKSPWREENVRGDVKITNNTNLMIRYIQDSWEAPFPSNFGWGTDEFPAVEGGWSQPSKSAVAKLTTTINSTTVNDFQFSWSANRIKLTKAGLQPELQDQLLAAMPSSFPGKDRTVLPPPVFWGSDPAPALWSTAPWENRQDLFVWKDDLSKLVRNHTFKAGVLYSRNAKDEQQQGDEGGSINGAVGINGTGAATGNGFADLLLRDMFFDYSEDSIRGFAPVRWRDFEFYAGDNWRVLPNLTLEYGFRWSFLRQPYTESDQLTSFNPAFFDPLLGSSACNGLVLPEGSDACAGIGGGTMFSNRALVNNNNHAIAPRLGFAWDINGKAKTVLRGGIGQFFARDRLLQLETALNGNPPFNTAIFHQRALDTLTGATAPAANAGFPKRGIDPSDNLANSWQWNLTVERELWRDAKVELSYVGNRGIHLVSWTNVNQILPGDIDGNGIDDRADAALAGDASPYRPFGTFGDVDIFVSGHHGSSTYHSFQSQLNTRFLRNSIFQLSYTWSKLLSDQSVGYVDTASAWVDNTNTRLNRGLADYDRRHLFSATMVYNAPTLEARNGFVKQVFGGWELNTIINLASGAGLKVIADRAAFPAAFGPAGPSGTGNNNTQFPNRVPGVPCHIDGGDRLQWLNPEAFTFNGLAPGEIGNARPGDCTGPPTQNVDFSINKNWKLPIQPNKYLGEGVRVQFRLEFFNLFNHPQFGEPDVGLDVSGGSIDPATGRIVGSTTSVFGRAGVSPNGFREIQYALKIIF